MDKIEDYVDNIGRHGQNWTLWTKLEQKYGQNWIMWIVEKIGHYERKIWTKLNKCKQDKEKLKKRNFSGAKIVTIV